MGRRHNNYSGFYKINNEVEEPKTPEEYKEAAPVKETISADEYVEIIKEKLDDETMHIPVDLAEPKKGVVVNCERVNVRVNPDPTAAIASIILVDEEIDVNPVKSTDKFYAVTTNHGIDGFIMKDFVSIL